MRRAWGFYTQKTCYQYELHEHSLICGDVCRSTRNFACYRCLAMPAVSSRPQVLSKLQDVPPSPLELMELVKSIDEDGAWIVFCGVRFRTLIRC
jgi:hypothetical protein